jgi:hypothetical protein
MGGVGQEASEPFLRGRAGGEGALDLGEHGVEGQAQPTHLGVGFGVGDALGQVARGNGARRGRHLVEGTQSPSDDPPREPAQPDEDGQGDEALDPKEATEGLVL